MAQPAAKQMTPVRKDSEGLQLDLRACDQTEKYLDSMETSWSPKNYHPAWSEKKGFCVQAASADPSEIWKPPILGPHPAFSTREQDAQLPGATGDSFVAPEPQRICGVRRGKFWIVLGLGLSIIIVGAIIGGVLAGKRLKSIPAPAAAAAAEPQPSPSAPPSSDSSSSPVATAPTAPGTSNHSLPQSDVMVDSPLAVVAYTTNRTSDGSPPADQQAYRLYFQSAHGNMKESAYDGSLSSWKDAHPIFTDAINNTGLAVITYANKSVQQSSIFYVGTNGFVQEKRLYPGYTVWQPGTINHSNLRAFGNLSIPTIPGKNSEQDRSNGWDSYRMAAVFSRSFRNGPGARLFYHAQSATGTPVVQEMIWNMSNDAWSPGHQFYDPWPNSDLSATIDTTTHTLRLFYSAGNLTLQESWLNMTEPGAVYKSGVKIPSILAHNDASLATVSTATGVLVYYYASHDGPSIRELTISGTPGSSQHPEVFAAAANVPVVAQPALITNASQISLYQPIGAVMSTLGSGTSQTIQVFWAEGVVDAGSGYGALKSRQRNVSDAWEPNSDGAGGGQVSIPLGTYNAP